jgi:acetyl esterase/lipase
MRKWLAEEYMTLPRTPPTEARSRSTANIHTETIPTSYGDGNQFSVRVYNPTADDDGLRPALIMYHGGGWIHGFPEVDEGNLLTVEENYLGQVLIVH